MPLPTREELAVCTDASVFVTVLREKEELVTSLGWTEASASTDALLDALWLVTAEQPKLIESIATAYSFLIPSLVGRVDALPTMVAGDLLTKKLRQYNTLQYYRQHKFNLLAEESQGYSKVLYLYHTVMTTFEEDKDEDAENAWNTLKNLMGEFSLDPNRCLDLLLQLVQVEILQDTVAVHRLIRLTAVLPMENLPKLLAFALEHNNNNKNILECMAVLVKNNLLAVPNMMEYLPPWRELLTNLQQQMLKAEKDRVRASTIVRLSTAAIADQPASKSVDARALKQHPAIPWLQILLQHDHVADTAWSPLCVVLPQTLGVALGQSVARKLDPWTAAAPPWKNVDQMDATPSLEDLLHVLQPLQYTLESGCLALCPQLVTRICRILATYNNNNHEELVQPNVLDFLSSTLLPIMGCRELTSPALSQQVWEILGKLPYQTRFQLYRKWKGTGLEKAGLGSAKPLWQVAAEIQAGKDTRYQLKRLSKDTIRESSRGIAKVCHGHPLVVFTTILNQIESYDNLVEVMVDALRFVTPLSLDVLGYCILSRLSGSGGMVNRSRLKPDGVNVSQWLQSLESFTGYFYKRFPAMELGGILEYLVGRLKDGHVMELGMLRTLLETAGGWAFCDYSPAASLSPAQLQGRSGSTRLKRETMSFGVIQKYSPQASTSIRSVLQKNDVGVSLLVLLAQVRHQILFENSDPLGAPSKPVKLIGNLLDTCQVLTGVLLDFLVSDPLEGGPEGGSLDKFSKSMPTLHELCSDYEMELSTAWMICRPLVRKRLMQSEDEKYSDFELSDQSRDVWSSKIPKEAWDHLTSSLFETFFTYSLYDMVYPDSMYKNEISRLEKEVERLKTQNKTPAKSGVQPGNAPSSTPEEEMERCKKSIANLQADQREQAQHVKFIHGLIDEKKSKFFGSDTVTEDAASWFLTQCIFPRCMQSPDDALYSAHFVNLLHSLETPGFGTLSVFDKAIVSMSRALFGVTEGEAANISIFLTELWKSASRWRYDENCFTKELAGKVGATLPDGTIVSYGDFKTWYNKWHAAVGGVAIGCLKSKEYIHIRNCLIVLTRLVDVFPTRPRVANGILSTLEPLKEESNPLADIRASAQAYSTQLLKARDDGVWKEEDAATVKARLAKEKAAEASRKAKAEEQMAAIQREAEDITKTIGDGWDRGGRGRQSNGTTRQRSRSPEQPSRGRARDDRRTRRDEGGGREDSRSGEADRDGARAGGVRREEGRRRDGGRDDAGPRNEASRRDGGARDGGGPRNEAPRRDGGRDDGGSRNEASRRRGLEGRFQPAGREPERSGSKRSREPSPEPGEESRKRPRVGSRRRQQRR